MSEVARHAARRRVLVLGVFESHDKPPGRSSAALDGPYGADAPALLRDQYMDKLLFVNLQGNRKISGYLRGFDIFLNLVLDEAREEGSADKVECGTVVRTPPSCPAVRERVLLELTETSLNRSFEETASRRWSSWHHERRRLASIPSHPCHHRASSCLLYCRKTAGVTTMFARQRGADRGQRLRESPQQSDLSFSPSRAQQRPDHRRIRARAHQDCCTTLISLQLLDQISTHIALPSRDLPTDLVAGHERDDVLVLALVRLVFERLLDLLAHYTLDRDLLALLRREPVEVAAKLRAEPLHSLQRDVGPLKDLGREGNEVARGVDAGGARRREGDLFLGRAIRTLDLRDMQCGKLGRGRVRSRVGAEEELGVAFPDDSAEGVAVGGELGERLAEAEGSRAGAVDGQGEVMRGDGRDDVAGERFDLATNDER